MKVEKGRVYLKFEYKDIDGDTRWFRLSSSGKFYLELIGKDGSVFPDEVVDVDFKALDDEAEKTIAKLLEIGYGEEASPIYLAMERDIPESGTFFIHDKDGLFEVKSGQIELTLTKNFEKALGESELEKLKSMLEGKKAALVLVYVGEDGEVHSAWSSRLEFSLHHPAKEGGVMGLHVVRVDGVDGVDSGGVKIQLRSIAGGGYELVTNVEGKELRIPIKETLIKAHGLEKYLKMELEDGNLLGFRMFVDDDGKMHVELAIYKKGEETFRDLRLIKFIPEIEKYYYQDKEFVLRNILVGEYVEEGKTKHAFMSIYGDVQKEILDRLNENPEHTVLEIWAIDLFRSKGEEVIGVEKRLEDVGRIIDVMTRDKDGVEILIECKHGTEVFKSGKELQDKMGQIEGFFNYAKSRGSKVRLFIGEDLTGDGAKAYVERAIELHEELGVPLEIYVKGELKSLSEVKQMVEG